MSLTLEVWNEVVVYNIERQVVDECLDAPVVCVMLASRLIVCFADSLIRVETMCSQDLSVWYEYEIDRSLLC